jgi:hypothetical protein
LFIFDFSDLRVAVGAKVAELVDAQDLGSCGLGRGGSSPPFRTFFVSVNHPREKPSGEWP